MRLTATRRILPVLAVATLCVATAGAGTAMAGPIDPAGTVLTGHGSATKKHDPPRRRPSWRGRPA